MYKKIIAFALPMIAAAQAFAVDVSFEDMSGSVDGVTATLATDVKGVLITLLGVAVVFALYRVAKRLLARV